MFSDILMTVDFDRTLTALDGSIPTRNLQAIDFFIKNGGIFTINTGRSYISLRKFLDTVPVNGPLLLLNGSAMWRDGVCSEVQNITQDIWPTMKALTEKFPSVNLELQAPDMHYLVEPKDSYAEYYAHRNLPHRHLKLEKQAVDFVKIGVYGNVHLPGNEQAEALLFDEIEDFLTNEFGNRLEIFRSTPRIINVHAKGVSKGNAARTLQKKLGRKMLICVGDEGNDLAMLYAADHAFCPGDSKVADLFENVCSCGEGAIADVIYKKIPQILQNNS